jgi:hypothetical protein
MTKIELEEILKFIDIELEIAMKNLLLATKAFDQQYYLGKERALKDIKKYIKFQHRHLLESQ